MNFLERLNKYMENNNLRQIDLVEKCNVNKSYISGLLSNKRTPNIEFLTALSNISGKSINWWLYGDEIRSDLYALNELIDFFISKGDIKENGEMDEGTRSILHTMLDKEIRVKLQNKKA
ncbi:helix-turn-helix family protein [Clostridium botulinum 202F]|nr:helix-turn-helix family protein [Clostridium botulinum 202F]KAI3347090.1 helix-turn-helix transcriptional regulator [Clostridium botulinum]KON13580.1 hypothetical protein ACP50_05810 [Clostridium botulinum]MBY6987119.1 helix-turn-helix transcriptional regulator [Clostridium botulinum]NFH02102.1 helix-turn-helix transcriptional regulator [Clostridium botulinum]